MDQACLQAHQDAPLPPEESARWSHFSIKYQNGNQKKKKKLEEMSQDQLTPGSMTESFLMYLTYDENQNQTTLRL